MKAAEPAEAANRPRGSSACRSVLTGIGSWAAHLVKVTRKEENMHLALDRSEILETDREGLQVWSGRPTVSVRSTPTLG